MKIINKEDTLIALISMEGSDWMKPKLKKLQNILKMFMPDRFNKADSSVKGYTFDSIRFDLYNRFAEKACIYPVHSFNLTISTLQGHGAPTNIHPYYLYRDGSDHKPVKVNHSQRIPHVSETIKSQPAEYEALVESLKDICEYVNSVFSKHLPEEYSSISILLEQLPLDDRPPTYPFGGFVLNIQVCTEGHRDEFDDTLCLIIPFGEYEGGELVLWEPGLVCDLKEGDLILFPSSKITHFNLHFKGFRGSVVMHSDKELRSWEDKNGWDKHMAKSEDFVRLYKT